MYINRSKYHVNHMLITSVVAVQLVNYVNRFLKVLSLAIQIESRDQAVLLEESV